MFDRAELSISQLRCKKKKMKKEQGTTFSLENMTIVTEASLKTSTLDIPTVFQSAILRTKLLISEPIWNI